MNCLFRQPLYMIYQLLVSINIFKYSLATVKHFFNFVARVLFEVYYYYYYYAFIKRRTSGLKTCSEALTRHLVYNKVNIKISSYAAAKNKCY